LGENHTLQEDKMDKTIFVIAVLGFLAFAVIVVAGILLYRNPSTPLPSEVVLALVGSSGFWFPLHPDIRVPQNLPGFHWSSHLPLGSGLCELRRIPLLGTSGNKGDQCLQAQVL
jgi:hypothetical protein